MIRTVTACEIIPYNRADRLRAKVEALLTELGEL
jgi:hypothetical protein